MPSTPDASVSIVITNLNKWAPCASGNKRQVRMEGLNYLIGNLLVFWKLICLETEVKLGTQDCNTNELIFWHAMSKICVEMNTKIINIKKAIGWKNMFPGIIWIDFWIPFLLRCIIIGFSKTCFRLNFNHSKNIYYQILNR